MPVTPFCRRPSLYIYRHAQDIKKSSDWVKNDDGSWDFPALPNVDLIYSGESAEVGMPWHRLKPEGYTHAKEFAKSIFNTTKEGDVRNPVGGTNPEFSLVNPIGRIITKNPNSTEFTQNPFDTVYELIKMINGDETALDRRNGRNLELILLNSINDFDNPELNIDIPGLLNLDEGLSTVICWDREGLWGYKPKDYEGIKYDDEGDSIKEYIKKKDGEYTNKGFYQGKGTHIKRDKNDPPATDTLMGKIGMHITSLFYIEDTFKKYFNLPDKGITLYKFYGDPATNGYTSMTNLTLEGKDEASFQWKNDQYQRFENR